LLSCDAFLLCQIIFFEVIDIMKFSQSLVSAGLLVGASSLVAAEDVLVSKRMGKRFIDDQGNYNICRLFRIPIDGRLVLTN
jgi:hypothetical protein